MRTMSRDEVLHVQDGVELAASLRDAALSAGVSWTQVSTERIKEALRTFERRRSARCAPLVALASQIGDMATTERSWLVCASSAQYSTDQGCVITSAEASAGL